jgi:hypothetical protein
MAYGLKFRIAAFIPGLTPAARNIRLMARMPAPRATTLVIKDIKGVIL